MKDPNKPKFPLWQTIVSDILLTIVVLQVILQLNTAKLSGKPVDGVGLGFICAFFGIPALIIFGTGMYKYRQEKKDYASSKARSHSKPQAQQSNAQGQTPPAPPTPKAKLTIEQIPKPLADKIMTASEDGMIAKRCAEEKLPHPFGGKSDFSQAQVQALRHFLHKQDLHLGVTCPLCQQKMERKFKWGDVQGWGASGFKEFLSVYKARCQQCGIIVQGISGASPMVFPMGWKGQRKFNLINYTREQLIELRDALSVPASEESRLTWETFLEWE